MELTFEFKRKFSHGDDMFLAHEPDGLFSQYYNVGRKIGNKSVKKYHTSIDYENDVFHSEAKRITSEAVSRFGIKALPQFGVYAFYTTFHSNVNKVIAPLNYEEDMNDSPSVACSQGVTDTTITITDPANITYQLYRVSFRQGNFADEFVSYESPFDIPNLAAGTYDLTVKGMNDDGRNSLESTVQAFVVT